MQRQNYTRENNKISWMLSPIHKHKIFMNELTTNHANEACGTGIQILGVVLSSVKDFLQWHKTLDKVLNKTKNDFPVVC